MYSRLCPVAIVQTDYAPLFINILGFGAYLLALEGPGLKREILGELSAINKLLFSRIDGMDHVRMRREPGTIDVI